MNLTSMEGCEGIRQRFYTYKIYRYRLHTISARCLSICRFSIQSNYCEYYQQNDGELLHINARYLRWQRPEAVSFLWISQFRLSKITKTHTELGTLGNKISSIAAWHITLYILNPSHVYETRRIPDSQAFFFIAGCRQECVKRDFDSVKYNFTKQQATHKDAECSCTITRRVWIHTFPI